MSLGQLNIYGKDKIDVAIDRLRHFEPEEGYYLAFSGGKDSVVIKALADMAKVKYDAHYNLTTVDPPELVRFIKEFHKDVIIERPEKTMWELIPKKRMPPTRLIRYCCEALKEKGGSSRVVITGVRWAESSRRKNSRKMAEVIKRSKAKEFLSNEKIFLNSDNDEKRRMFETCFAKEKRVVNPIIDWTDGEVWQFIQKNNLAYCKLYDEGFNRLGCIGCPMQGAKGMERDFIKWPKYRGSYIRAFEKMIAARKEAGLETDWNTGEEVMSWWIHGK